MEQFNDCCLAIQPISEERFIKRFTDVLNYRKIL